MTCDVLLVGDYVYAGINGVNSTTVPPTLPVKHNHVQAAPMTGSAQNHLGIY